MVNFNLNKYSIINKLNYNIDGFETIYTGMVCNKTNKPHGFGIELKKKKQESYKNYCDELVSYGQYEDGK